MATVHNIHFCLRPSSSGVWTVQNDADHAPAGVDMVTGVIHDSNALRVYFSPTFDKAGSVQITSDDGFAGSILANASLGTQCVRIELRAFPAIRAIDAPINPAHIWTHLNPALGYDTGNGNLWVNVTMVNN